MLIAERLLFSDTSFYPSIFSANLQQAYRGLSVSVLILTKETKTNGHTETKETIT
jgi:hypothetical protein